MRSPRWGAVGRIRRPWRWPRPWAAEACEIYTDVTGVFTTDPRTVPAARKIDRISYEEMLELAAAGARVLSARSVEYARRHGVRIHVRSSFDESTARGCRRWTRRWKAS